MIHQIARIFREHPEYLLYVFLEDEYTEFRRWSSQPCGEFVRENPPGDMPVKAIALGLMDVSFEETYGHCVAAVSFAADLQEILKPLKISGRLTSGLRAFLINSEKLLLCTA